MDRLANTVRPYAWGSVTALPELMGTEPTGEPQAEMWMGAHPAAPSRLDRGAGPVSLAEAIAADPETELGAAVVRDFGPRLPFLLKLLAADAPLSLQVHPDPARAAAGFAEEDARGVPPNAPHRNYRDTSHKPELICALTPFDGLCGFRPAPQAAGLLDALGVGRLKPYADMLRAHPESDALREVLTAVLTADREAMAETVAETAGAAERLAAAAAADPAHPLAPHAAAYAACAGIARHYPGDGGVIAAMLLHHVRLQPGEALYLGAGVPHAYLRGLGVEVMANSDNVLRCGLTPKHVDVPELLRVIRFTSAREPGVLRPQPAAAGSAEEVYPAPVDEFRLSRFVLSSGASARVPVSVAPQILLCTGGRVTLHREGGDPGHTGEHGEEELVLAPGRSAYVRPGEAVGLSGEGTLFRATVAR